MRVPPDKRGLLNTVLTNSTFDTNASGTPVSRILPHFGADFFDSMFVKRSSVEERLLFIESLKASDQKRYRRFIDSYKNIQRLVSDFLGDDSSDSFSRNFELIKKALLEYSIVVQLQVDSEETAFQVFEVLNARGLDLSQADLVKNKLLNIAKDQKSATNTFGNWEDAANAVRSLEELDFILAVFFNQLAFHDPCKASYLYKTFCDETMPKIGALQYSEGLKKSCEYLRDTLLAIGLDPAPGRDVQKLVSLKDKYSLLLLIACANLAYNGEDHQRVLKAAHHFSFRAMKVQRIGLGAFQSVITEAARKIAGGDVDGAIESLKDASPDSSFEDAFAEISVGNTMGFYIMEMFEHHKAKGAGLLPLPQGANQHIEHILPKRPNAADWPNWDLATEHPNFVDRVGNLTVLEADINQKIKHKSFTFKKSHYAKSKLHYASTAEEYASPSGEWSKESIVKRQQDFAALASTVWAIV